MTLHGQQETSVKRKKTLKISANIYTCCYFGLMRSNKKSLKMTESDQFDLLFKSLLIFAVQMFFSFCVLFYSDIKFILREDVPLQLALIFCTLLLHLGCVPGAKSGIYMMKYSLCHPEAFSHAHIAFLLGFMQICSMWIAETINIMKASQRKTAQELITSYIGFKSIIDLPTIYLSSINNLPIKGKIGNVVCTKPRKQAERTPEETMYGHSFFNMIYVACQLFFRTFYFYFFPFTVIFLPLYVVLKDKEMQNDL